MRTPPSERVAVYLAATHIEDEKLKRRLVKKYGVPPEELEIGFLVEEFKQTPWQLGLCPRADLALLYRAKQAVRIYSIAKRMDENADLVTAEDFKVIAPLNSLVFKKKK